MIDPEILKKLDQAAVKNPALTRVSDRGRGLVNESSRETFSSINKSFAALFSAEVREIIRTPNMTDRPGNWAAVPPDTIDKIKLPEMGDRKVSSVTAMVEIEFSEMANREIICQSRSDS